jgi:periplasmic protein TonB
MFDDSLMESAHKIRGKSRYWSVLSMLLNLMFLAALVVWPLLHPMALPREVMNALLVAPSPPVAPPASVTVSKARVRSESLSRQMDLPNRLPRRIEVAQEAAPPSSSQDFQGITGATQDGMPGLGSVVDGIARGPAVVKLAEGNKRISISSGVMAGNLMVRTIPDYPAIARAARVSGVVVLQATISTSGEIKNLRAVSGPGMLQQAAIDAVRSWRYKPYLLNGTPVEVETTINVIFNLGQ